MAFNSIFSAFRMEKREVNQDNKTPNAATHHLSAATTNAQCELEVELLGQKKPAESFHHSLL